jgi:hypothetical protein
MAIEAEFKAKEIEIAFPQQDIYIKNLSELPVPGPGPNLGQPGSDRSPVEQGSTSATTGKDKITGDSSTAQRDNSSSDSVEKQMRGKPNGVLPTHSRKAS